MAAYSDKKSEDEPRAPAPSALTNTVNSPTVAIFCYCASSILMTVTNKYVLSVGYFNFNCILLAVQVCSFYLLLLLASFSVSLVAYMCPFCACVWFLTAPLSSRVI